ncbi:hypothetical protein CI610_01446 [invertebrate metagenome]|uniref:Uncharacterized protein n=1 Tax=invertebrate metagenome TaxID=1711999 RepID=A0A2H9T8M3_9ZZZZ
MDILAIQRLISTARQAEMQSEYLHKQVLSRMDDLIYRLDLPEDNPDRVLYRFAIQYIEHVDVFIRTIQDTSDKTGVSNFVDPFLAIAIENFLSPQIQGDDIDGLDILLDKAYFTHRLVEEVNDCYMVKTGTALLPINMTWANVVIHAVLGEPFANEIDSIVEETVQQMMASQAVYDEEQFKSIIEHRDPEQWIAAWSDEKSKAINMDIDLHFTTAA